MQLLEHVYIPFFYGLPTVNGSRVCHKYCAVREELCYRGSIVSVKRLVILFLEFLWIDRAFLFHYCLSGT
jgi:hypothetical protein